MARSLIGGLIADGWNPSSISVGDPDSNQLSTLASRFQVRTDTDNHRVTASSEVLVLAVKPQVMHEVALDLAASVQTTQPLVISVAAGIRTSDLARWLGGDCALVRCMPNTPALVQSGATALFATGSVSAAQKDLAENILRAVGLALWVDDEDLMDAVTALSGSGPAYVFLIIEALQEAGQQLGLKRKNRQTTGTADSIWRRQDGAGEQRSTGGTASAGHFARRHHRKSPGGSGKRPSQSPV